MLLKKWWKVFLAILLLGFTFAQERGAEFVIITPDAFRNAVMPLAEWKTKKGITTKVVTLSEAGRTPESIRNYLISAYNNWQIRPRYLLIFGGPDSIPFRTVGGCYTDNYYANMNADMYNELYHGRISAVTITQVQTVVNKILNYERTPYSSDTTWFKKGVTVVREDGDPVDDSIYWSDARYVHNLMRYKNYIQIDSFSYYRGNNSSNVYSALNGGRAYLIYRGQGVGNWYSPFSMDPDQLANGLKLPVVGSFTCKTMATSGDPMSALADKFVLTGTPQNPRGAIASVAVSTVRVNAAQYRSALAKAFSDGIYSGSYTLGEATENARRKLNTIYPGDQDFYGFHLLGDPTLMFWTDVPKSIVVNHDTLAYIGLMTNLNIQVSFQNTPVESAFVCVMQDTSIYLRGYTDRDGNISFSIIPQSMNPIFVTVTGRNLYPYEGVVNVREEGVPHLQLLDFEFFDVGNNNGIFEPGEGGLLFLHILNAGDAVFVPDFNVLRSHTQGVYVSDSISFFDEMAPGDTARNIKPFVFNISPLNKDSVANFEFQLVDTSNRSFTFRFSIPIQPFIFITGPDDYGYFVYDYTDTLTGFAPQFSWLEIATGLGTIITFPTNPDADTATISLPFSFPFYGITYNSIGICTNGFIEMGNSTFRFAQNTPLPSVGGPKRVVAPFWTDLDLRANTGYGNVYYYYDQSNHRFIVEFHQCAHYGARNTRETFQVVFLDPTYYPTPTGDGEILFYYHTVSDPSGCTVGIEDHTEMRGLTYLYNGSYSPGAVPLQNGVALLITTKSLEMPWVVVSSFRLEDKLTGNGDGIAQPGETLQVYVTLLNRGNRDIHNVTAILRSFDSDVVVKDSMLSFELIGVGDSVSNEVSPLLIYIDSSAMEGWRGLQLVTLGDGENYYGSTYLNFQVNLMSSVLDDNVKNTFSLYPNPFKDKLFISLSGVNVGEEVEISIFNIMGRQVFNINERPLDPHLMVVDLSGDNKLKLPQGVYFVKVHTGQFQRISKVIKVN